MARPKSRPKRRERKNVEHGVAHIKSTFNNTIITITDTMVMLWPGPVTVVWGLKEHVKALPLLPN